MSNILIIPDIHGRTFWKECIKCCEYDEIIFLGDYLDPYSFEGISKQEALDNFKEILKFKSDNYDKVTLLLGNHDMEYISYNLPRDRYDSKNGKEIRQLFLDNIDMFNLVTYRYIKNKFISFSHSVICQCWINDIKNIDNKINSMNIIDFITYLNALVKSGDERKMGNILNIQEVDMIHMVLLSGQMNQKQWNFVGKIKKKLINQKKLIIKYSDIHNNINYRL